MHKDNIKNRNLNKIKEYIQKKEVDKFANLSYLNAFIIQQMQLQQLRI